MVSTKMSWPWISPSLILKQHIPVPLIVQWHTPFRTFASKASSSVTDGSLTSAFLFLIAVVLQRSSTSPFHLLRGLPLVFAGCFGILLFCTLSARPNHLFGRTLQNFTISSPSNMPLSPCLLYCPELYFYNSIYFS